MTGVSGGIGIAAVGFLYDAAFEEARQRLTEIAKSRARLVEAMTRFHTTYSSDYPDGPANAVVFQLKDAHGIYEGFGKTGEFTLAKREADDIRFILSFRHAQPDAAYRIPIQSKLAEPMRRALAGLSGTLIGLDYRGVKVLAAHEPVGELDLGIVAKIDLAEIRAPFLRAGIIAGGAGLLLIAGGALVFFRVARPILQRVTESEKRFRDISHSMADWVWEVDREGRYTMASGRVEQLLGYKPEELLGKTPFDLMPQEEAERVSKAFNRIAERRLPIVDLENLNLTKSGERVLLLTNGVPILDELGQLVGYRGVDKDITARKNAERSLQESERYNRTLFEQSPIGLALCRLNGALVDCNLPYSNIVGRTPEEMTHLSYWDLTPKEYAEQEQQQLKSLRSRGFYGPYEKVYIHKDGHRVPVRLSGRLLKRGGETFIWSSVEDISETVAARRALQESRSRFALFMDNLPAAIFIKDARSRVLYVNQYLKTHFGARESQGAVTCAHFSPEDTKRISLDDSKALVEGQLDLVERLKDRTGQERTFRTVKFAIPRSQGQAPWLGGIAWDITDALAASESLARSKRRYRELFEIAQEGIWLIDAEGNTVEVNERMAQMLGYTPEEMRERHLFDFMDTQERKVAEGYLERRRQGIAEKYDFRFRTKKGADCWAIVSTAPMYDAQGAYAGALRMVTDITERKRGEDALRTQEEQLRSILASTGEGIFGLDMHGNCTFANRACLDLLGYDDVYDLLGKKMHELIHHTHHDGTEYPVEECPTYRSCTLRHVTFADDEPLWRADGSRFHAQYQSFPMVRNDEVVGAVVTFADITERKKAETALKRERDFAERLIDTAPVIVLLLDPQGNIIRFNSFMEKLSGYRLSEVRGKNWFGTFLPKRDMEWVNQVFAEAKGGTRTSGNLNAIVTRDGEERLIAWYDTTLQDPTGALTALLAIGHDVTDQKAKEAQLQQAQKMETVGQLTGGIAHDFNNLLTVILGNLDLVAKAIGPDCDPELSDLLQDMNSAAKDGAELTKRLLAFSRRETLQHKHIDLPAFLGNLQRFLQRTLGADIAVQVAIETNIDELVSDPHQLENALLNLALNARDAMPHGGRLSLQAETKQAADLDPTLEPGNYAELSVIDTGEGMNPEQLSRAIEPFYTTKASGHGSGLGLSMVFSFCEQAGGRFRLASQPGVGTQATIVLPLDGLGSEEDAQVPESEPEAEGLTEKGTVLVVEDEVRVRKLAGRYLRDLGYDVLMAEDGERAIEILRSESAIDLVFSDVVMPGKINGDDLYRWVIAQCPQVKVLLTTGLKSPEINERSQTGKPPVPIALPKPYTKAQLSEAIRDALSI